MNANLPAGVYELLANRIDSFEKLEVVVALHGAPHATRSVDDLCRVLTLPRETVRQTAMELRAVAMVAMTARGEIQLLPPTIHDQAVVAELVRLYQDDRISLVTALGEIAMDRLRGMASRAFADAFVISVISRKPRRDGDDG